MKIKLISLAALLINTSHSMAYPTVTHAALTSRGIENSLISINGPKLAQLGIDGYLAGNIDSPFKTSEQKSNDYFALYDGVKRLKGDAVFEQGILNLLSLAYDQRTPKDFSVTAWVMRGAIREDDNDEENAASDDPGGVFARPFAHFFDPFQNSGLNVIGVTLGPTASEWALQEGALSSPVVMSSRSRKNVFNIPNTKELFWRALTGLTKDRVCAAPNGGTSAPANEDVRRMYWAGMFRSLGDSVHLLQDMAQPQHTRNDAHSGLGCFFGSCLGGHDSFYEKYIGARTLNLKSFALKEGFLESIVGESREIVPRNLDYLGYAVPMAPFKSYADFFSTGTGSSSLGGLGLANYSNRGFYSFGTNEPNGWPYPSPDPSGVGLTEESVQATGMAGQDLGATITFHKANVPDTVMGTATPARLSTVGAWDQFMEAKNSHQYSLTYYNYDDQAALLIPRAVGYTTAFINFFFRGRLEINLPDEGVYALIDHSKAQTDDPLNNHTGFSGIKLKLSAPASDSNGQPQILSSGVVTAVLKFHRNKCYVNTMAQNPQSLESSAACRSNEEEVVVSAPANDGVPLALGVEPKELKFKFDQALPINAIDVRLQVIYRGKLGSDGAVEDDAIVVETKDISEPTFFSYLNATDYYVLAGNVYTREQITSSSSLMALVSPDCVDNRIPGSPQLWDHCLRPKDLPLGFRIGSDKFVEFGLSTLPLKRLIRVAFLTDSGKTVSIAYSPINTCAPFDPFVFNPISWGETYTLPSSTKTQYDALKSLRGIWGWVNASCVKTADESSPGTSDNRKEAWQDLTDVDPTPVEIVINNGQGYP